MVINPLGRANIALVLSLYSDAPRWSSLTKLLVFVCKLCQRIVYVKAKLQFYHQLLVEDYDSDNPEAGKDSGI